VISKLRLVILFGFISFLSYSQTEKNEEVEIDEAKEIVIDNAVKREPIDALAPSKAAFYSAVLPGLGQAYNKKYWKIPIVYAAIGTGIYFYIDNNNEYKRYRNAYKRRLAGFTDDEFYPSVSNDALIRAQKTLRRNKEISLLVTIGIYALNIIDANVDAHLLQFNVDENLAVKPHFKMNEMDASTNVGLTLGFKF